MPASGLCTYEFIPNIDAGPQDTMKVQVMSVTESTPVVDPTATTTDPSAVSQIANEPSPDKVQYAYATGNEYLTAVGSMTDKVVDHHV